MSFDPMPLTQCRFIDDSAAMPYSIALGICGIWGQVSHLSSFLSPLSALAIRRLRVELGVRSLLLPNHPPQAHGDKV